MDILLYLFVFLFLKHYVVCSAFSVCGTFLLDTEHAVQLDVILKEMTCGQLGRKRSLSSSE